MACPVAPTTVLTGLLLVASGCPGNMILGDRGAIDRSEGARASERMAGLDRQRRVDLPVTPGVPCLSGACGPNLICMANICLKTCTQPAPSCNDKVPGCAADESCMFASSFTDACYPASAKLNDLCDSSHAIFCVGGTACVKVGTAAPRCVQLCKYGCPSDTTCGKTTAGCDVCVPS